MNMVSMMQMMGIFFEHSPKCQQKVFEILAVR